MCGISGIVGLKSDYSAPLVHMVKIQNHRGPDANSFFQAEHICLGHNRLSIIDLHESANQPFHSACGRFCMVFNGEIYNYQSLKSHLGSYPFVTQSDTEVLLALYSKFGPKMLDYINGMFAFAIWDKVEQRLFCARDRFGVKPFYYSLQKDSLFFASEIKALHAAGINREMNHLVLSEYISSGTYGMPEESFWKGICQLPGGHQMTYELKSNQLKISSYYDFVGRVANTERFHSFEDLVKNYSPLLSDAVALRFISDVPVGFNLSGGLDSSLLLALVNSTNPQNGNQIEAFTFFTGHSDYDELPYVKQLLQGFGNPLNAVKLQVSELPKLAEELAGFQDEPYGGFPTIAYAELFHHARQKGIKVLLDGQGMDEAWAGYDYYQFSSSTQTVQGVNSPLTRPNVFEADFLEINRKAIIPTPFDNRLQNLQYRDLFFTKIPRALRFNDRASMQHSVELREPFLDYRLVEFAFAQDSKWKIREGMGKWFLRQFAETIVPEKLSLAPKRPLQTPQREWLRHELKNWADSHIQQLSIQPFIRPQVLFKEWENYQKGLSDNSFYIWQWINLNILLNSTKNNGI